MYSKIGLALTPPNLIAPNSDPFAQAFPWFLIFFFFCSSNVSSDGQRFFADSFVFKKHPSDRSSFVWEFCYSVRRLHFPNSCESRPLLGSNKLGAPLEIRDSEFTRVYSWKVFCFLF